MSIRFFFAVLAVVAVPAAVAGSETTEPRKNDINERRYCERYSDIRSRLSGVRRCQTKAERDAMKHEARQVVDRIQMMKATRGQ